jgi:hypothetical protein
MRGTHLSKWAAYISQPDELVLLATPARLLWMVARRKALRAIQSSAHDDGGA